MTKDIESLIDLKLRFNVTVAVLLFLMGTIFIGLYFYFPDNRNNLVFCASVIAGMTAIYSAFYAGKSLQLQVKRDMLHRSFDLVEKYADKDFANLRQLFDLIKTNQIAADEVYQTIINDEKMHHPVISILGLFELIAISINKEYADEKTLYAAFKHKIPSTYKLLEHYIDGLRNARKSLPESQHIYCEFEELAKNWSNDKYLSARDLKKNKPDS
jgi:hypothetical protein